jgi:3-hydroxyisobutyrate dehydrogenase-like beta-hydroxyacid dehydrogenase
VQAVLLGEDGVAEGAGAGTLCVDMSTIAPGDSRRIAAELAERDIGFVDAPVTGSSPKAEDGTLTIMASGAPEHLRRARPLFEVMGELIVEVGDDVGLGEMVKLINNAVAAANAHTLAQALVVGRATGVDLDIRL